MELYFKFGVCLFLCWLLVLVQGDSLNDLIKCENENGNCNQLPFGRVQQNVSNVSNVSSNNLSLAKRYEADDLNDLDLVENRMAYEQAHTQENGNFDMNT